MLFHGRPPQARHGVARTVARACGVALLVGLAAAGVLLQPMSVASLVPLALTASVVSFSRRGPAPSSVGECRGLCAAAAVTALAVYLGGLSVVGLVVLAGLAATPILTFVLVCVGGRWWVQGQRTHGWLLIGDDPHGEPLAPLSPLELASTAQLCRRWRASYLRLGRAPGAVARERIAAARRDLLAEFERRDPPGFARFLASREPAARYPVRFCRTAAAAAPPVTRTTSPPPVTGHS
jgi:hypothetical protein